MAELSEEVKDLKNSVAYTILDELQKDGAVAKGDVDLFKSKYAKLHECVLQTYENERNFLTRAKQLNQKLMQEKIKLEKTNLEAQRDEATKEQLGQQILDIQNEYEIVQDRHMMLQIQLSELEQEKREKQAALEEKEIERQRRVEPTIDKHRVDIDNLQKDIDLMRQQKEAYQQKLDDFNQKILQLESEVESNKEIYRIHEMEYTKVKGDPERIRKQAEKFESAVNALMDSQAERKAETEHAKETLRKTLASQKELEDERSEANFGLQIMTENAKITEQSCEDARKRLEREKNTYAELVTKRVSFDQELDELNSEHRMVQGELSQLQKHYEKLKRHYKKTQVAKDGVDESLGPLQSNKKEMSKQMKLQEEEIKRQKKLLEEIQGEVDLFIGAYLKQESLEKDKVEEFSSINQQMDEMQKELRQLKAEEQQWSANFKSLASQREKLARDASTAHRLCRETGDEVAMKQLEEDDLKKKYQEISQKQKMFCTMYEVVKNERNKSMASIQKSQQQLSEMREKFKILENEVEILRMESAFKDKELLRTKQDAHHLEKIKDQLQNDKMRISAKGAALNEQVEQYLIEIDKLNSIINAIEKEMVVLRRKYEQAVETRNFTGTQLIDRNDELCILWEKSNIQERILKKGEDAMLAREEEIRGLKIDLKEVKRQLLVVERQIPEVPKLSEEVAHLRAQVTSVRRTTDDLSKELENPKSSLRKWRKLGGEDLNQQTLRLRIQNLEERLNDKKESLLEKELILEEVTALSEKLRQQAFDGRQGTMELSQKVNVFQARIKDVTRKMMATVSELSMHQATAHKLEKERDEICELSMLARERLQEGLPPTDTADAEFDKMLQTERQRELDKQSALQRRQEEEIMNSNFTRTTAEPRVNAYIPEDEHGHGLPKAYGASAPFKPTLAGTTMRHIRKPNPKPIEI